MKKFIILFLLSTLTVSIAQNEEGKHHKRFSKKFKELEKIKLIETLNLDEETTLRFFARRNSAKNKIESLLEDSKLNYKNIEEEISQQNGLQNFDELLLNKHTIEKQIIEEREKFINSLNDILTKEQILKFVLFERKFKMDIRDLLIEKGRRKFKKERIQK